MKNVIIIIILWPFEMFLLLEDVLEGMQLRPKSVFGLAFLPLI